MKTKFGISKNVFVLGLVSFFNDVASEMIYPLVPIFLTSVLAAPVAIVGLIEGIAESSENSVRGRAFGLPSVFALFRLSYCRTALDLY